jgi:hypothetical protein
VCFPSTTKQCSFGTSKTGYRSYDPESQREQANENWYEDGIHCRFPLIQGLAVPEATMFVVIDGLVDYRGRLGADV